MLDSLPLCRFFYGPGQPLVLPANDIEVIAFCGMFSLLGVCMVWRGLFYVLLVSLT